MIQINLNLVGTPTDTPELKVDTGTIVYRAAVTGQRAVFSLPDQTPSHGFTVRWAGQTARSVVPDAPGSYEGGLLDPPLPDLVYGPPVPTGLRIVGDQFMLGTERFLVRGCTDFRLCERVLAGVDIRPLLHDRTSAGANWLRIVSMKADNTGWELNPRHSGHQDAMRKTFDMTAAEGCYVEWVVFADTRALMPTPSEQQDYYVRTCEIVRAYPHVLVELVNEDKHGTQQIDVQAFSRPAGILASHGSGLTDQPAVKPYWDYATYHGRRMAHPQDGRAAVAYSPFGFEEDWPKPCPFVNEESAKPVQYGFRADYARLMGLHACCGSGGTFHHDAWNEARPFTVDERRCAMAFFQALGSSGSSGT